MTEAYNNRGVGKKSYATLSREVLHPDRCPTATIAPASDNGSRPSDVFRRLKRVSRMLAMQLETGPWRVLPGCHNPEVTHGHEAIASRGIEARAAARRAEKEYRR